MIFVLFDLDGTSQNELTIVIDGTQTPPQLSLAVSNNSWFFISFTNSDEPLPSENLIGSLPLVNSGESLPPEDFGESLPLVGSNATIPNNNNTFFSTNTLYSESEAMDLYSNSDLIDFNNNSRPFSSLSTSCSTSSVHRFWCNYNKCRRTFRSQGEWQEHQYQHYGGSPFICLVEDCASFRTIYSSKSNLRHHYRQHHSNQSHAEF
ncbi:hypothetical protein F8M41_015296 [Gigaspora margarita]|uniref:C2H2-type domain-containing protein n=1 Tax=Gigaspora margarita TaxID=4874 RepID=A0A8H4AQP1_GIGMA|nr:hypothetical protein F8M41_015296 [Gigaspora margarita]